MGGGPNAHAGGPSNAEGEVAVARLILNGGELLHGFRHLADALALDPQLPDAYETLVEFVAHVGGTEHALSELDQVEGQGFIGTVAVRAHVHALAGQ